MIRFLLVIILIWGTFIAALGALWYGVGDRLVTAISKDSPPESVSSDAPAWRSLYRDQKYSEAVSLLRAYIEENPNDAEAHFTMGDSLYFKYSDDYERNRPRVEDLHESLEHLSRAIELRPSYAEAYGQRGLVRSTLSDREGAKSDFDTAISLEPKGDRAYFNRGYWFEEGGLLEAAIEDYRTYVALTENSFWSADAKRRIETLELKLKVRKLEGGKSTEPPQ